ncbi:MAG: hypothetical protein IH948_09410 [Bacteroidetes bacterium]|nr:hypothetical protein [Bacteroidota bacterium]
MVLPLGPTFGAVNVGVGDVGSDKDTLGPEIFVHAKVIGSLSGSKLAVPSSCTSVFSLTV